MDHEKINFELLQKTNDVKCKRAVSEIQKLRVEVAELKARLERAEKSGTGQPDFTKVGGYV